MFPKESDLRIQISVTETLHPHSLLILIIFQQSCLKKPERKERVQQLQQEGNFLFLFFIFFEEITNKMKKGL
jgi:hypothetical protein